MTTLDLFAPPYNGKPGFKKAGTSERAAEAIAPKAETIAERCYRIVLAAGPAGVTPDEAAALLDLHYGDVRPRFTELSKATKTRQAMIRDTGRTRPSARGNPQSVWVAI